MKNIPIHGSIEQTETEYTSGFADGWKAGWNEAIHRACDLIEQGVVDVYGISEDVDKLRKE